MTQQEDHQPQVDEDNDHYNDQPQAGLPLENRESTANNDTVNSNAEDDQDRESNEQIDQGELSVQEEEDDDDDSDVEETKTQE